MTNASTLSFEGAKTERPVVDVEIEVVNLAVTAARLTLLKKWVFK
jgi:hypothetical protein